MEDAYTSPMTTIDRSRASREALLDALPPPVRVAVERIATATARGGTYIVAGAVRDALIGRRFKDIDLATEDDAIETLRRALPDARITTHERFRTGSLKVEGVTIDVATTRTETYERPGALPRVAPASIVEDLWRRDFSVNALAVSIDKPGGIIDPTDGLADLEAGRIRVLHERSFEDDPTRIYRALRYAGRLGFALEPRTASLLAASVGNVSTVSGARLRREIELVLQEPAAGAILEAAHVVGALRAIHPALNWDARRTDALTDPVFDRIARLPFGFAVLAAKCSQEDGTSVIERLRLRRAEAQAVMAVAALSDIARTLRRPGAKPSGVAVLLDRYPAVAVAAFAVTCDDPIAGQVALRYLAEWRDVKPLLRGDDLESLGVPAGPQIEKGLQLIRAARLDGWASDEGDERALVLRFAKSIRDSSARHADVELHLNGH
jgi:tRNA nucleotidyltransferase (CCA-adding enzyme)